MRSGHYKYVSIYVYYIMGIIRISFEKMGVSKSYLLMALKVSLETVILLPNKSGHIYCALACLLIITSLG